MPVGSEILSMAFDASPPLMGCLDSAIAALVMAAVLLVRIVAASGAALVVL